MNLEGKNILLISPEPWDYINVSKHHYARELARRKNRVYFLNPPVNGQELIITASENIGIYVVNYSVTLRGQRYLPAFLNRMIDRRFYEAVELKAKCKFDVIWNFENSRFYDLRFAPPRVLKIYHQVDLNQNYHPAIAAHTADICFCTTEFIKTKLSAYNTNVYKINHGFSGAFSPSVLNLLANDVWQPEKEAGMKAFYVGNLDIPYLDVETLEELVHEFPQVQFIFIGPHRKEKKFYRRLSTYANVVIKTPVPATDIPRYLEEADILLLVYKTEKYLEQLANPHKLLEYLAAGKITVASYTDEYRNYRNLLLMAAKREDISVLFRYALENLSLLNAPDKMRERVAFAKAHTYNKQLNLIDEYVQQLVR